MNFFQWWSVSCALLPLVLLGTVLGLGYTLADRALRAASAAGLILQAALCFLCLVAIGLVWTSTHSGSGDGGPVLIGGIAFYGFSGAALVSMATSFIVYFVHRLRSRIDGSNAQPQ